MAFKSIFQPSFGQSFFAQHEDNLQSGDVTAGIPPAVTSSYISSSAPNSRSLQQDPLIIVHRREMQLQADLQTLLDAQSEGLVAGLTGGPLDDTVSEGSLTPTASSVSSAPRRERTIPIRQPLKKRVTLRGARKGIVRAIQQLAEVKAEEMVVLEGQMQQQDRILRQVDQWDTKTEALRKKIQGIEKGEEGTRAADVRRAADDLQMEIMQLENRLMEMKARHRGLLGEAERVENSVQSRLSSYKESLSIVEGQVKDFLARPPLVASSGSEVESAFLSLHPSRRTLDMAKEHWNDVQKALTTQRSRAEMERDALEDGAVMWEDVVRQVTDFEKTLRSEMRRINGSVSGKGKDPGPTPADGLRDIIQRMDGVITQLESKLKLAETRGWKLLVCCVGAELEAFREGREILQGALDASEEGSDLNKQASPEDPATPIATAGGQFSSNSQRPENGPVKSQEEDESQNLMDRSEDEDDEPDPELLISHQESY